MTPHNPRRTVDPDTHPTPGIPAGTGHGGTMNGSTASLDARLIGPGVLLLACRGSLSWEDRHRLAECVRERLLADGLVRGVVMDMARLESINSAGVAALFQLQRTVAERGGRLIFINVAAALQRLFRMVGLDRPDAHAASLDAALDDLNVVRAAG